MSNTLLTRWTTAHQAPLTLWFSRQEYWSELPFSSAGVLSHPGIKPASLALQADSLPLSRLGNPWLPYEHSDDCWISMTNSLFKDQKLKHQVKFKSYETSVFEIRNSHSTNTSYLHTLFTKCVCHLERILLRSWSKIPVKSSKRTHGIWSS